MSKNPHTSPPETAATDAQTATSGLASDAMARRRMLLKSLGKGSSVIAAAALPMHTLAGTGTLAIASNGKRCTVSSMASGVHSKETVTETCSGRRPSNYGDPRNWPSVSKQGNVYTVSSAGITSFTNTSPFSTVFGGGASTTIGTIMSTAQNSDEAVWITALFNAIIGMTGVTSSGVKNFPYTPAQVIALHTSKPTAVAFFRDYLQSV
nr:hypothetical protein [uncultured Albidiferax sp.]